MIGAHKSRFGVRELLTAAYTQEPNEKAALFRVIGEIADKQSVSELLGRVQGKDPIARVHIINILARGAPFEAPASISPKTAWVAFRYRSHPRQPCTALFRTDKERDSGTNYAAPGSLRVRILVTITA